ncbi:MAG: GerMN domain-containing protein [Tenericutes bacterium]|nr:GerMN domain-containing protein [Mycoplasmatota bacterium]
MLRTKALRKIFITTLSLFILVVAFSLKGVGNTETLAVTAHGEVENKGDIYNIYLLNKNNLLVRSKIYMNEDNIKDRVYKIINSLKDSNKVNGLSGVIPSGTKLKDVIVGKEIVTLNFSKDILKVDLDKEKNMISSIVYSILELDKVEGVSILVEDEVLNKYPVSGEKLDPILNKSIGINKVYDITSRNNINEVVIYYLDRINNDMYYVPVTKYINDDREKIKIIVEELASSYLYEGNLISFLNSNTVLLDYQDDDGIMRLNFNDYIMDGNDKLVEEVIYTISLSVFDNYPSEMVSFEVNGEVVGHVSRSDLNKY